MQILKILFYVSLAIVFYTYIGYGILLYICVKVKKTFTHEPIETKPIADKPEITLFIAAYNEQDVVRAKMENTQALDYPKDKLKVLWVTDGSTDGTNDILKEYDDVIVLYEPKRGGKTAAINRGIPFVSTPIVVFTDANTMINPEALTEIAARFEDPHVGCVAGEKRIVVHGADGAAAGGEGIYWKYESALKSLDSQLCTAVGAAGELFAVRKHLFEQMPNDTLLDDFIMSMKIAQKGYKIDYCATAYACESGSADMGEEQKRKVRISAGGLQSIYRLRALLNIFKYGTMSFQYISHRVLRWSITPLLMFLLLPLNVAIVIMQSSNIFFWVMLVCQLCFYTLGLIGYKASQKKIKNKILFIPYYFLFMNVNVVKGAVYLCKKKGSGAWEKAKRA